MSIIMASCYIERGRLLRYQIFQYALDGTCCLVLLLAPKASWGLTRRVVILLTDSDSNLVIRGATCHIRCTFPSDGCNYDGDGKLLSRKMMLIMIMVSCCIGRSRLLRSVTREAASFPSSSSLLLPQILYSTITLPTYIHTQSLYTTLLNVARTYHPRHKKSQVTIYTQSGALGAYKWRNSCLVRNFRL